jgi:hypothetical protein
MIYPKIIFSKLCIFQIIDKKMIYVEGTPLEILVGGGSTLNILKNDICGRSPVFHFL